MLMRYVAAAMVADSLVALWMFADPNVASHVNSLIYTASNELKTLAAVRHGGLIGISGASGSILHSLYFAYLPFGMKTSSTSKRMLLLLGAITVAAGMAVSGRSGILAAVFFVTMGSVYSRQGGLLLWVWGLLLLMGIVLVMLAEHPETNIGLAAAWTIEPFVSLLRDGELSTSPQTLFQQMLYLPGDEQTLLFGKGVTRGFETELGLLPSDSGYVQMIFEWGIVATVSFIVAVAVSVFGIRRGLCRFVYGCYVCMLIVFHVKEPFIFKPVFARLLWLLFAVGNLNALSFHKGTCSVSAQSGEGEWNL
ncbi:MAG: hypothetical protein GF331_19975 [Chitinivibrionales bacterium]|nr:hypothetical protein [Chitinivibrionales bacterium]